MSIEAHPALDLETVQGQLLYLADRQTRKRVGDELPIGDFPIRRGTDPMPGYSEQPQGIITRFNPIAAPRDIVVVAEYRAPERDLKHLGRATFIALSMGKSIAVDADASPDNYECDISRRILESAISRVLLHPTDIHFQAFHRPDIQPLPANG